MIGQLETSSDCQQNQGAVGQFLGLNHEENSSMNQLNQRSVIGLNQAVNTGNLV